MEMIYRKCAVVLAALFMLLVHTCNAEIRFDDLQKREGFEQEGSAFVYRRESGHRFQDGETVLGLEAATRKDTGEVAVCLYAALHPLGSQAFAPVTSLELTAGEEKWSFHGLAVSKEASIAFLDRDDEPCLLAIAGAERVVVRLTLLTRHLTFSLEGEELEPLKEAAQCLVTDGVLEAVPLPDADAGAEKS